MLNLQPVQSSHFWELLTENINKKKVWSTNLTYFVILESGDVNRNICKVKVLDDILNINGRRGKEY